MPVEEPTAAVAASLLLVGLLHASMVRAGLLDWATSRSDQIQANIPWLPFENETRCYDEIGCLNVTREWYHLIYRPFNVFPLPREVIATRFVLYTRKNPEQGQVLRTQNNHTISKSYFDSRKETKFIIHGFLDTPLSNWVKEMRRELVHKADWNVIVVDWAGGSLPLYTQATANTRLVGLELGYFINYLIDEFGVDASQVHLIGHSLGAHTAGYAGLLVEGLGRITGLDPAEPYFQGMPPLVRLDPSDARLVDVIHTDGNSILLLGYGMSEPCGHLDFYPNNGKEQPGCDLTETPLPLTLIREGLEEASRVLVACNHIRAIKLFIESINSECPFIAHQCDSYKNFKQGRCFTCQDEGIEGGGSCAIMGLNADRYLPSHSPAGAKYFFSTTNRNPFCQRHYRVTVELAQPPKAEAWVQGFLRVSLFTDKGTRTLDLTPNGYVRLQHGQTRSFMAMHPAGDSGARLLRAELYWEYDMDVLQPRSLCFFWCNDHLYVSSVNVAIMAMPHREKRELMPPTKLCAKQRIGRNNATAAPYAEIASKRTAAFAIAC